MKKYRRIEIKAFRHRVTRVSGESRAAARTAHTEIGVRLNDADSQEIIDTESAEGQEILAETIRLLEEKLTR